MKFLVLWFGGYQLIHAGVNLNGLSQLFRGDVPNFPAAPPLGGWNSQVIPFFIPLASLDLIVALASLIFVYGFLKKKHWSESLGVITLSCTMFGFLTFAGMTIAAGAWVQHPTSYAAIYVPFFPILFLFFLFCRRAMSKR